MCRQLRARNCRVRRGDVQSLRAHHQPVQAGESQAFGLHGVAGTRGAASGADVRRPLRQRERRDFDPAIPGVANRAAGLGKRAPFERLVAHGMAEAVRHELSSIAVSP